MSQNNVTNASKLKNSNVCRVFFSSPFNGMEGERETLTKKYWPQLQVNQIYKSMFKNNTGGGGVVLSVMVIWK